MEDRGFMPRDTLSLKLVISQDLRSCSVDQKNQQADTEEGGERFFSVFIHDLAFDRSCFQLIGHSQCHADTKRAKKSFYIKNFLSPSNYLTYLLQIV